MTFLTVEESAPIASPASDDTQSAEIVLSEPAWIFEKRDSWGEHFSLPEWEDHTDSEHEGYRAKHGWKVRALIVKESELVFGFLSVMLIALSIFFRDAITSIASLLL